MADSVDPAVRKAALIRLVRVLGAGVVAMLATWLVGPGPGDVFGVQVAAVVVPVLTAVLSSVEKAAFGDIGPQGVQGKLRSS